MRRRRWLGYGALGVVLLLTLGLVAARALAGGWAVSTLDELPAAFVAGETYPIGFTIRQHGVTPFSGAKAAIRVQPVAGGEVLTLPAPPDGTPGHYVAPVRFPADDTWTWAVEQWPFQPQPLGTLAVVPAPVSAKGGEPLPAGLPGSQWVGAWASLRIVLPVATLVAGVLFVVQVLGLRRARGTGIDREPEVSLAR